MTIWALCEGEKRVQSLIAEPWRIVEAQHISSSRDLVDTVHEHDILEALIEESKPSVPTDKSYLIFTPFRYPPLKYGSRFGHVFEPSIWYGSLQVETAFAEVAYYRWLFLSSSDADLGYVELLLTAFQASIQTERGVLLTEGPFLSYTKQISDPNSYDDSQSIGTAMRDVHVQAFVYYSARTSTEAKNIGVFTPDVFFKKKHQYIHHQQTWNCIANKESVEFTRVDAAGKTRLVFTH